MQPLATGTAQDRYDEHLAIKSELLPPNGGGAWERVVLPGLPFVNSRPIEVLNSFSKGTSSSNAYPQMGGASKWEFTLALSFKRLQVMEEAWDCEYSQASLVKSTWLPNS